MRSQPHPLSPMPLAIDMLVQHFRARSPPGWRRDLTSKEEGVLVFMDDGWAVGRANAMGREAVTEKI